MSQPIENYWWLVVHDRQLAIMDQAPYFPQQPTPPVEGQIVPLGEYQGQPARLIIVDGEQQCPAECHWDSPRALMEHADEGAFRLGGKATQMTWFHSTHRFCGHCGSAMTANSKDIGVTCTQCGLVQYPQISPCIIVAVRKDNKILLASSPRHRGKFYTVIAGFVEPAETLEETVHREVYEETHIHIRNLRYIHSQPWPFPSNLMAAYLADYDSGEVEPDHDELAEAAWFSEDELPPVAPVGTIARTLIDMTFAEIRNEQSAC